MTNKLDVAANGDQEIVMTRLFDAPRHLVFEALTVPALLKRWFKGPDGWSLEVCEIDLRVGGAYRYVWTHEDGRAMDMSGTYREIEPVERIVQTERFGDDWTGGETLNSAVLAEVEDGTRLTTTIAYASREARDAAIASNMAAGAAASYAWLDALLLEELRARMPDNAITAPIR